MWILKIIFRIALFLFYSVFCGQEIEELVLKLGDEAKCMMLSEDAYRIYCEKEKISYTEYVDKICEDFAARKAGFAIQAQGKVWYVPGIAKESGLRIKKIILHDRTELGYFEINGAGIQVPFSIIEYYDPMEEQIGTDEEFCVLQKWRLKKNCLD